MKIIYNKNPLCTTIELDEHEKETLWYKIKVEELIENVGSANFAINPTNREWYNKTIKPRTVEEAIDEALRYLDLDYLYGERSDEKSLDRRVDELHAFYLAELQGVHVGDCTCVPCSCLKCHAEQLLEINTIKGLGKHSAYKVNAAFGKKNERTLDEAIKHLRDYKVGEFKDIGNPNWTKEHHDYHIPRWEAEAKQAYEWLKEYKDKFFPNN